MNLINYYNDRFKVGFTLIELLVVIAIIGVLASIVLAALNSARSKGNDAAIKSNLDTIRTQAEIYYDTNGNYGVEHTVCNTAGAMFNDDPTIAKAINSAKNAGSTVTCESSDSKTSSPNNATSWAVSASLKSVSGSYFCVDSTGASKIITTNISAVISTPYPAVCP